MNKLFTLMIVAFAFVGLSKVNAQKLDKFGADMGKKSVMGKEVRVPYSDVITYYGYIKAGAEPDEVRDGNGKIFRR